MAGTVTIRFSFDQVLASVAQETITVKFLGGAPGKDGIGSGDMLKSVYDPNDDGKIDNAQLNDMAANTIKGRQLSSGAPGDLSASQVRAIINVENGAEINTIDSIISGEPTGSDQVLNVVSLTTAEYDAGTPIATTLYIITDA